MGKLIIEVVEHGRSELHTHHFDRFPVHVGRGYDNDLILADPFVSPNHLRLTPNDAGFTMEDLDSENGTSIQGRARSGLTVDIESGATIKVGTTTLRILSSSHPVPQTLRTNRWAISQRKGICCACSWGLFFLMLCLSVLDEYFQSFTKMSVLELMQEGIPVYATIVFIWASLWSLIGYSTKRQTGFCIQLLLISAYLIIDSFLGTLLNTVTFSLNLPLLHTLMSYLGGGVIFGFLLFSSVGVATTTKKKRRIIISAITTTILILLIAISNYDNASEFSENPKLSSLLKPPCIRHIPDQSISELLTSSEQTFSKIQNSEK